MDLLDLCERRRVPTRQWFDEAGLDPLRVREGIELLSYRQACSLVRRALRALPKGPWGFVVGVGAVRENWGLVGLVLRACATFGDALALGVQHHPDAGSLTDFAAEDFPEGFAIRVDMRERDPELEPFLMEKSLSSVVSFMRFVSSPGFTPARVELAYPPPPHVDDYRKFFQCPVGFNAPANRIYAPRSFLATPMKPPNSRQLSLAHYALQTRTDVVGAPSDLLVAVRERLRADLRGSHSMARVAEKLHTTERTLRRHLAASGRTFTELRDEVRAERALALLRTTSSPIKMIAAEVGYRDEREFQRAFRRWTGQTPKDARSTS